VVLAAISLGVGLGSAFFGLWAWYLVGTRDYRIGRRCYQPTSRHLLQSLRRFPGRLVAMDGEDNHVHLLVNHPANIYFAEQPERRFEQNAWPRTTRPEASLLQRRSLVAVVFCRQWWWCSDWHPQGVTASSKTSRINNLTGAYYLRPAGRGFTPHG
jgi:hypothetical protein